MGAKMGGGGWGGDDGQGKGCPRNLPISFSVRALHPVPEKMGPPPPPSLLPAGDSLRWSVGTRGFVESCLAAASSPPPLPPPLPPKRDNYYPYVLPRWREKRMGKTDYRLPLLLLLFPSPPKIGSPEFARAENRRKKDSSFFVSSPGKKKRKSPGLICMGKNSLWIWRDYCRRREGL